jgi:signal transduction histidine kinase/ActR/RegA family two-component response regulator
MTKIGRHRLIAATGIALQVVVCMLGVALPQYASLFAWATVLISIALLAYLILSVFMPLSHLEKAVQTLRPKPYSDLTSITQLLSELITEVNRLSQLNAELAQRNQDGDALNKTLVGAKHYAERLSVAKSITIANLSHEVRTAVNAIVGVLDLTQQHSLSPEMQTTVKRLFDISKVLVTDTNNIVNATDNENEEIKLTTVTFSLNAMLKELMGSVISKAQEKSLTIRLDMSPDTPSQIISDPMRISQIFMSLVANAIKFTDDGSIRILLTLQQLSLTETVLVLCVEDSGHGMPCHQVAQLLENNHGDKADTAMAIQHQGFGLCMVKRILRAFGGTLNISSTVGIGSTFSVSIPIKRVYNSEPILSQTIPAGSPITYFSIDPPLLSTDYLNRLSPSHIARPLGDFLQTSAACDAILVDIDSFDRFKTLHEHCRQYLSEGKKIGLVINTLSSSNALKISSLWPGAMLMHPFLPDQYLAFIHQATKHNTSDTRYGRFYPVSRLRGHVLLVEDNPINIAVTSELLSSLGLSFDVAENGKEALTKVIDNKSFDLILMDIQMPIMNGREAARELRRQGITLPIIGLSASAMPNDREEALSSGMNGYLLKPIRRRQLAEELAAYLSEGAAVTAR